MTPSPLTQVDGGNNHGVRGSLERECPGSFPLPLCVSHLEAGSSELKERLRNSAFYMRIILGKSLDPATH